MFATLLVVEFVVLVLLSLSARSSPESAVFAREGAASVAMSNQSNVVHDITVDRVVTPVPGWLVAQADSGGGTPGMIVGSRWVSAGLSQNVAIPLNSHVAMSEGVYVTLLADGGEQYVLEYEAPGAAGETTGAATAEGDASPRLASAADKPLVAGGSLVQAHADVTRLNFSVGPSQALITESTMVPKASSVVIPRVVAPAQSWVAVSLETTSGQLGGVLGTKLVAPGEHSNVVVPLNVRLEPTTVIATLHVDLGTLGRFDFSPLDPGGSADQPYVAGGRTVSAPVHFSQ